MICFDDGSVWAPEDETRRKAFEIGFGKDDLDRTRELIEVAVDRLWSARREPVRRGGEQKWQEPYAAKAELAAVVLRVLLNDQFLCVMLGVEKYGLLMMDPETGRTRSLKGQEALEAASQISRDRLLELAERGGSFEEE